MPFLKPFKHPTWKTKEESTLKSGLRHAVFNSKGDTKYIGEWKDNKKSGKGFQIVKDKWVYEGDWLNGKRHGYGIMSEQDEFMIRYVIYEGEWKFGKPHGFGTRHFSDGSVYEGDWVEGKRWGKGKIWYDDMSFYEGSWKNDKPCGKGLKVYSNGNRYEGNWFEGMKYGKGDYYHLDSGQLQTGVWVDDVPQVSLMSDISRQSALSPTPYSIQKLELKNWPQVYGKDSQSKLHYCDAISAIIKKEWKPPASLIEEQ